MEKIVMKIPFQQSFVKVVKSNMTDRQYCYTLSQRNMSVYLKQSKSFKDYAKEFKTSDTHILKYKNRRFGFFEYEVKDDGLYIWDIQLSKILQGKGLGTQILQHIKEVASQKNSTKLVLFVYSKNPAVKLYTRFGFKTTKEFPETSRIKMEKIIK